MNFILDATPLIHVTKAGYDWIFNKFEIIIPGKVYEEVVETGKSIGAKDAFVKEKLIKNDTILIRT